MKKILFLGGSVQQLPAIKYANENNYYTILCDYLLDNPGQYLADEFYCISTTNKEEILNIALKNKIDGIVAYASDPAALTAAFVASKMNLPSNPYKAVEILSKKDLFREFLKNNKFKYPNYKKINNFFEMEREIKSFRLPVMIKPIDSSGSKGINKVYNLDDLSHAYENAMINSREKAIIIEEFIESSHDYMIAGDVFVVNGKVKFWGLLNSHRNKIGNPFVPIGTSFPTFLSEDKVELVKSEIQRLVRILNINFGALNLELMFDKSGDLYIIEVGPRNGGNMIPDLLYMATGVNLIEATVETALGNQAIDLKHKKNNGFYSTYVIHSLEKGILDKVIINSKVRSNIIKDIIYKKLGDKIEVFDGANKAIGITFFKYDSLNELKEKMNKMNDLIKVKVYCN